MSRLSGSLVELHLVRILWSAPILLIIVLLFAILSNLYLIFRFCSIIRCISCLDGDDRRIGVYFLYLSDGFVSFLPLGSKLCNVYVDEIIDRLIRWWFLNDTWSGFCELLPYPGFQLVNVGFDFSCTMVFIRRDVGFLSGTFCYIELWPHGLKAFAFMLSSTFIKCWILDGNIYISSVLFFSS